MEINLFVRKHLVLYSNQCDVCAALISDKMYRKIWQSLEVTSFVLKKMRSLRSKLYRRFSSIMAIGPIKSIQLYRLLISRVQVSTKSYDKKPYDVLKQALKVDLLEIKYPPAHYLKRSWGTHIAHAHVCCWLDFCMRTGRCFTSVCQIWKCLIYVTL